MPPVQPMLAKSVKGIPDPAKFDEGLVLRAQIRRVPLHRVQGRRRGGADLAQHQAAHALLPRGRRRHPRAASGALRARRRAVRLDRSEDGVRGPPGTHPPGRVEDQHAGGEDARLARDLRRARVRRRLSGRPAVPRASPAPRDRVRRAHRPDVPHPDDHRDRRGTGMVRGVRGRRDSTAWSPNRSAAPYQQNARTMLKIKHERTADVVLAGYRLHKTSTPEKPLLGSMLLGLYADGEAAAHRRLGILHRREAGRAARGAQAPGDATSPTTLGVNGRSGRSPTPTECRARRAAGAAARTCPSLPCAPSGCSRSSTTPWKAGGSGTPRTSSGGGPIATRSRADTSNWSSR